MENLDKYAEQFDTDYPSYADVRYSGILALMSAYNSDTASALLASESFKQVLEMILPIIAVKNYKSQIPFPEDVFAVVESLIKLKGVTIDTSDRFSGLTLIFNKLESIQGFQLPTISAVFHFCHPENFPIVDINVQAACMVLIERNSELAGYKCPKLPAPGTSAANKLEKYKQFIELIDKILDLQSESQAVNNYRSMDKALMVLGGRIRRTANTENKQI